MDYSIHEAIEAGVNHMVFIIRKVIGKESKKVLGDRVAKNCEKYNVNEECVFYDINYIPSCHTEGRTKPRVTTDSNLENYRLPSESWFTTVADIG